MRAYSILPCAALVSAFLAASSAWSAPPVLRHQADQRGDARVIGSSLAVDCHTKQPLASGAAAACAAEAETSDTAPDLYWHDSHASALVQAVDARTAATLELPAGAKVTYARLYWASLKQGSDPDTNAVFDCPSCAQLVVDADASNVEPHPYNADWYFYQSSGDVTAYVASHGAGAYRVTGVDGVALAGVKLDVAFAAWTLVVFYEKPTEDLRNLALFDGLFHVDPPSQGSFVETKVNLAGFLVPASFDAKMSAFVYEGDYDYPGDHFAINGVPVSNGNGNPDNFFDSSRTYLGAPVSGALDEPKLSGLPDSMAGYDLHTVDVSALVKAADTTATISADSIYDKFYLGGFVTSLTDKSPWFSDFTKTVKDLNGGLVLTGDELEYTIKATNTGSDDAVNTTVTDALEAGLAFVPGSIRIVSGGVVGLKTDPAGDDQGEYEAASKSVTVRVGSGATATKGGLVPVGASFEISFRAKVVATQGVVANHALLTASGSGGGTPKTWQTDADPNTIGNQDTVVTVDECQDDSQCSGTTPHCDTSTHKCVPCGSDADCTDPNAPACQSDGSCGECSKTNDKLCEDPKPVCVIGTGKAFCGCDDDADCGDATSGRVCDLSISTCIDGCRGKGGNGCPTDESCTSLDTSIGECVPPVVDQPKEPAPELVVTKDEGSCACSTPGSTSSRGAASLIGVAIAALACALMRKRSR
ncbi:MAG: DUF11 domain-containing protein [Deltaproteobacteria bacterium]|nr:DUF11 domain-containing protein [Deltaproteobacteria bacterium]